MITQSIYLLSLPLEAINPAHTGGDFTMKSNVLVRMGLGKHTAQIGHSDLFI